MITLPPATITQLREKGKAVAWIEFDPPPPIEIDPPFLQCPDEYESCGGFWESCGIDDHCAACGGSTSEHTPLVAPLGPVGTRHGVGERHAFRPATDARPAAVFFPSMCGFTGHLVEFNPDGEPKWSRMHELDWCIQFGRNPKRKPLLLPAWAIRLHVKVIANAMPERRDGKWGMEVSMEVVAIKQGGIEGSDE